MRTMKLLRRCALMICLLAFPGYAAGGVRLNVRVNTLQGVLDLAYSYCGGVHESVALQKVLESSGHRSGEAPEAIVRFCGIDIHRGSAGAAGRPEIYDTGWSQPWHRFTRASVVSADMTEFADSTAGVFTFEEQRAVIDAMQEMSPIYEQFIEMPYGAQAKASGEALSEYLRANEVGLLLHRIAGFYSVPWPEGMPLWIGLSPIPPGSPGFSATVEGNVVRSFMPVDFDRPEIYAGVLAHEYGHVLYANLPERVVSKVRLAFANSNSHNRRFAEVWMNEALATAAGNGWVYRKLVGRENQDEWYSDPVVDAYAKAMASAVYAALESGGELDSRMIGAFVEAFDKAFPDAMNVPDVVLPHAVLVVDTTSGSHAELDAIYRKRVQTRALRIRQPMADAHVPGYSLPTVLRIEVKDMGGRSSSEWRRRILDDGSLEYSTRISAIEGFDQALEALITRIVAADWQ